MRSQSSPKNSIFFLIAASLSLFAGCRPESNTSYMSRQVEPVQRVVAPTPQPDSVTAQSPEPIPPPPRQTLNWQLAAFSPASTKVDVLFVLDTSQSMRDHLNRVRDNLAQFSQALSGNSQGGLVGLNLRVGFVSPSDPYRSSFRPDQPVGALLPVRPNQFWIDSHVSENGTERPKRLAAFQAELRSAYARHAVEVTLANGGIEFEDFVTPMALFSQRAQSSGTTESQFVRQNSNLLVFFVSNGDSENGNGDSENVASPRIAVDSLLQLVNGDRNRLHMMGALMTRESPENQKDPGMRVGVRGGQSSLPQCRVLNRPNRGNNAASLPEICTQRRGPVVLEELISLANRVEGNSQNASPFQRQAIVRLDTGNFGVRFAQAAQSLVDEISEVEIRLTGETQPKLDQSGRPLIWGYVFNLESSRNHLSQTLNRTIPELNANGENANALTNLVHNSGLFLEDFEKVRRPFRNSPLLFRSGNQTDAELHLAQYSAQNNSVRIRLGRNFRQLAYRTPLGIWIVFAPREASQ